MRDLQQHPLSAAFPAMPDDEFEALKDSVAAIGVQNAITLFDGMVIDGWHRYRAANDLDLECPTRELDPLIDPRDFVLAQNKARRNCTASQLGVAAAKVYEWKANGGAIRFQSAPGADWVEKGISAAEIAERAGVSTRTIEHSKKVIKKASPEVKAAVERGEVSVKAAAKVADLPHEQQAEALRKKPESQNANVIRAIKNETPKGADKLAEENAELRRQLADVIEQRDYATEELDALRRAFDANDQCAQLAKELEQAKAQANAYRATNAGLMNRANEAIRLKNAADRKIAKLEARISELENGHAAA